MLRALAALGERCAADAAVVVVGGAAAVLCEWIGRATIDIDVIDANPKLTELMKVVDEIADELGQPERWLNDGARAFIDVLPADFRERLVPIGSFGGLSVSAVSRMDFVLLKIFAMRAVDIEDLQALQPTAAEISFVREQLPRIAGFDARRAHLMELYLTQGEMAV